MCIQLVDLHAGKTCGHILTWPWWRGPTYLFTSSQTTLESHGCGNPWIRPQSQPLSRPCAPLQKRQRPRDDFLWCVSLHSWNGANPRSSQTNKIITELVVWNIFSHILEIVIPTDFHIFQRGRYTTNQICTWPVVSWRFPRWFPQWILSSSSLSHGEFILVPNCNSEALFDFRIPKI